MKTNIVRTALLFFLIPLTSVFSQGYSTNKIIGTADIIDLRKMKYLGSVDERFQSYNIEMCEVIGGDFWIPYELLDSVLKNTKEISFSTLKWKINPIDLYEEKLRNLAAALGPTYVRVSGTWDNDVYFQNDDEPKLKNPPKGFNNILTRNQWKGVVDFCNAVDGKIVTSFAISDGMHDADGVYQVDQVRQLIDYTKSVGGGNFCR